MFEGVKTVCVTGANGFIASWIVLKLLQKGYKVHGTVRNPDDEYKCGHLKKLEGAQERLLLFKADLLDYESLISAISGCDAVFHTACPVSDVFENPDDILAPAIEGTENVLKACLQAKIKRVVMTSSSAAVTQSENVEFLDDNSWSSTDYCKNKKYWYALAKTESEKLAWQFSKEHNLDLITICPVFVLGPLLQETLNASVAIFKRVIDGTMVNYPRMYFPLVDVRDTADAHIAAFEDDSASGRYLCFAKWETIKDVIERLKPLFPDLHYPESEAENPTFKVGTASNERLCGLIKEFTPYEQMLADTIHSFQEKGLLG